MGARQLLAVGFRLLALWFCLGALQLYGVTAALMHFERSWGTSWTGLAAVAACLVIALAVWVSSALLARGLMSGLSKIPEPRLSPLDIVAVGCVLIGLWWLKESLFPLVAMWLRAIAISSETGRSAIEWLGVDGKLNTAMEIMQIAAAASLASRPYQIAKWLLRHAPVVADEAPKVHEPFHVLLRRASELGHRQIARPDIVARLVKLLASHPDASQRMPELEGLLCYGPNRFTRITAARSIIRMGREAAVRARSTAVSQLADEDDPSVISDLDALITLADERAQSEGAESEETS